MDESRYVDLRGRLDAAEAVLRILVRNVGFADEAARDEFMTEVRNYADGMRAEARGNPLSEAQADAMDAYVGRLPQPRG